MSEIITNVANSGTFAKNISLEEASVIYTLFF